MREVRIYIKKHLKIVKIKLSREGVYQQGGVFTPPPRVGVKISLESRDVYTQLYTVVHSCTQLYTVVH